MDAAENPTAGQGPVVLDIGGDIGALIVSAPATMAGAEIELCPRGKRDETPDEGRGWWQGDWRSHHDHAHGAAWPHVSVLPRPAPGGVLNSAVFPGLRAGGYELWIRGDPATSVAADVRGGEVTTIDWLAEYSL